MRTASIALAAAFALCALSSVAAANGLPRPNYNPREAAKDYAKSIFGAMGKVTVASKPVLSTGTVNPVIAYRVKVAGQNDQAVIVHGGFAGYTATGVATIKDVKVRGGQTVQLPSTGNDALILRTRGKSTSFQELANVSTLAESATKTTRTAAFQPVFPNDWCGTPVPGAVRPMIYPGPSGNVTSQIGVTHPQRGQDIVKQPFTRMVIMAGNGPQ